MRTIGGLILFALEAFGQDDDLSLISPLGLEDDFIDFVEDGGGLDGASYDYAEYTVYDGTDEGRSRPTAEQLEALRAAAAASTTLVNPDEYEYISAPEAYEYTEYSYDDGADDTVYEAPDLSDSTKSDYSGNTDYVFEEFAGGEYVDKKGGKSRRPVGSVTVGPEVKQLVGNHFDVSGYGCYSQHAFGVDTASTVAALAGGQVHDCRGQGNGDFCFLEVRTQAGKVRQISTGCAQADYCAGIHNFGDSDNAAPFLPEPARSDQCKPTRVNGVNTFMVNKRFRNQESVCRTCFYTNDGTTDGSNSRGLLLTGSDLFILDGAGTPSALHSSSVTDWERQDWYDIASSLQTI